MTVQRVLEDVDEAPSTVKYRGKRYTRDPASGFFSTKRAAEGRVTTLETRFGEGREAIIVRFDPPLSPPGLVGGAERYGVYTRGPD